MTRRRPEPTTKGGTLKTEAVSVEKLLAMGAPYNPRTISPGQLAALGRSLATFGAVEPVVANRRTGLIVGGHQRVRAAQGEGIKTLPVVWVDLDETQERQLNLALNRISGEWDEVALAALLEEMGAAAINLTGFESAEVDELIDRMRREARAVDPDEVPEPPKVAVTKPGDLWILGKHRLLCGDATKAEDVARVLGGGRVALLATDPPYGVDYANVLRGRENQKAGGRRDIGGDDLDDAGLYALVHAALSHCDAPTLFLWHAWKRVELSLRATRECGWRPVSEIVWVKNALVFGRSDYQWRHECCIYAKRDGAPRQNDRTATTVWEFPKPTGGEHPTAKPVGVFEIPIRNHTEPGEVVYEPFAGSGSQFIAAEMLSRRCFGLEIDPIYCDVIVARWENFTGKKATLEPAP